MKQRQPDERSPNWLGTTLMAVGVAFKKPCLNRSLHIHVNRADSSPLRNAYGLPPHCTRGSDQFVEDYGSPEQGYQ